jgi:hypothetical protein
MKAKIAIFILFVTLGTASLVADEADTNSTTGAAAGFQIGQASFPLGDSIEITSVERSADTLVVKGHYQLDSADQALLALYTTTPTAISVATDPKQLMKIFKGKGNFKLTDPNLVPGWNHVSMYSVPGGSPFAGVYFGNEEEAAAESKLDLGFYRAPATSTSSTSSEIDQHGGGGSLSAPNRILLEYLGDPVEPPLNMDVRYTTEGLSNAVLAAARNTGIKVKYMAIEDSEFPFIIGVICQGSDVTKLKSQFKKMDGYTYNGSIGNDTNSDGSDTCNVFSIVPYKAYPLEASRKIHIDRDFLVKCSYSTATLHKPNFLNRLPTSFT